jgi:hypothetical protein
LVVQADGFSIYKDGVGKVGEIGRGVMPDSGGHISYLPGSDWIVGDTYPDSERNQHLYLYHIKEKKMVMLGSFKSPIEYTGSKLKAADDEWRRDLHPRLSPDGRWITIDSPHGGNGRQIHLIDISQITNGKDNPALK